MTDADALRYSDRDIDDALNAVREQADAVEDDLQAAGMREAAEFFHRYLRERDRLTDTHE